MSPFVSMRVKIGGSMRYLFLKKIFAWSARQTFWATKEAISLEDALAFPLLLPGRDHILRGMIDRGALFRTVRSSTPRVSFLHALYAGLRQVSGNAYI